MHKARHLGRLRDLREKEKPGAIVAGESAREAPAGPKQECRGLEGILAPEASGAGAFELAGVLDAPAIQSLMDRFYAFTSIPMAIIDVRGNVLVGVGWQEICTRFHRVNPDSCRYCIESDTELTTGVAPGKFKLYKCKNNLWDVATPLILAGEHVGNVFIGQFFLEDEPVDVDEFRSQAKRFGFNEEEYLEAVKKVPRVTREYVDKAMSFFIELAHMLSHQSYVNLGLARSLKERENLLESLRQWKERLDQAEEIAHLGSWILDLTENRLSWSDEIYRIFGLQPQQFAATYEAFLDAVHPDDRVAVNAAYSDSVKDDKPSYEIEHRVIRKNDGEIRWVHERCQHIRNEAGKITKSVGMVLDITDRKKNEEDLKRLVAGLERSNRDLEQFAYVASHDLQEPLRQVSAFVQLMQASFGETADSDLAQYMEFVVEGAQRMQRLILDLLAYARLDHPVEFQMVSLQDCLDQAMHNLRETIRQHGAVINSDALPSVRGERTQLTQVFQNLIGNAIKFRSEKPPCIKLGLQLVNHEWVISVRDNGIGFEPAMADKIFRLFQRLHNRDKYQGTGIGLTICKRVVERHGGRIWVESSPGKGAAFFFSIPAE